MGAQGAVIMSFFGAVFASLTLYWQEHVTGFALGLPFVVFAVISSAAARILRLPGRGLTPSRAARRTIAWSSAAEGVGLFIVANIVMTARRPDLLLPAMALVVGVHFLPIARATRFWPFYIVGLALIVAAAAGFVLSSTGGGSLSGFAAATALWCAAGAAVLRDRKTRRVFPQIL